MGALLALLLLINSGEPMPDLKHEIGMDLCLEVADTFGYDACMVELSGDTTQMWFHMMCVSWDAIKEREVYDEQSIIAFRWEGDKLIPAEAPPLLLGCPVVL